MSHFALCHREHFRWAIMMKMLKKPMHSQTFFQLFWLSQYPVTNAQWARAVKDNVVLAPIEMGDSLKWYNDSTKANAPVVGVNWLMARNFAAWLGCRLPT